MNIEQLKKALNEAQEEKRRLKAEKSIKRREAMHTRWRLVLKMRSRGSTFKEIGEAFGIHGATAYYLHTSAMRRWERGLL